MRASSAIFKDGCRLFRHEGKDIHPMTGPKTSDKTKNDKPKPQKDPTEGAPFKVDPDSDDFATPRNDLSEDELKEQEDRRR